ncbi:molybdopterin molybdotransferase MoeA [Erythrobacter mangrovi]|uniref:Molybdopterin molybdenumtransferase n=1 Tax=Erythrobacter mangrovi TaxID=2739433 RepID=A0A7D4CM90_9SPHN|nr:molybdopterin molybdotransferase MoeA [Erythrobacter mangrovi]QKG71168.1 molybdopterin molybdotransferase MoeA [Erythrobacter mangrovi]
MPSFDEAIALLAEAVQPLGRETVTLSDAGGRFLAAPLHARTDAPRHTVSAMDGYAVVKATTEAGHWLDVIGESRAGGPYAGTVASGQAVRIFTGASLPAGADYVIVQEHAVREGQRVQFTPGFGPGDNLRLAGSDFRAGQVLVPAGTRLTPRGMVAAAAADLAHVEVSLTPSVAIIATGDELAAPGSSFDQPNTLPESGSFGVAALAECAGATVVARCTGPDDMGELEALAAQALADADCVVVIGGASVGDHDLAKPMFAAHGLELVFSRLDIRPGRPVWLGRAQGKWVLGLPGNPTSAMVTARLFLRPLLAGLQDGSVDAELVSTAMPLAAAIPEAGARETFIRASAGPDGLVPVGNQESGAQSPLLAADWLIRRAAGAPACEAGELVQALAF